MKNKSKNLRWIPSILVALVIAMGACMKLIGTPQLTEIYSKIGLLPYIKILGGIELLFTGLFLYNPTMKVGFLLLTGYFGGAMGVELANETVFIFPAAILSVIWVSAFLRRRSLFLTENVEGDLTALVQTQQHK
jgi:hypothetical protein